MSRCAKILPLLALLGGFSAVVYGKNNASATEARDLDPVIPFSMQRLRSAFLDVFWRKSIYGAKNGFFSLFMSSVGRWKDRRFSLLLGPIVFCAVLTGISFPALAAQACPVGIHPAENEDALVENMFNFLLDIYNQKIVSFSEDTIHCYFRGDVKWVSASINPKTRKWSSQETDQEPPKWNFIRIKNSIKGKDYSLNFYRNEKKWGSIEIERIQKMKDHIEREHRFLRIYRSGKDIEGGDYCIVLNGKDRDFDPLLVLLNWSAYIMVDKNYHEKNSIYGGFSPGEYWEEYRANPLAPRKLKAEGQAIIPKSADDLYGFEYSKNYGDGKLKYKKYNFMFHLKVFLGMGYCYTTDDIDTYISNEK